MFQRFNCEITNPGRGYAPQARCLYVARAALKAVRRLHSMKALRLARVSERFALT